MGQLSIRDVEEASSHSPVKARWRMRPQPGSEADRRPHPLGVGLAHSVQAMSETKIQEGSLSNSRKNLKCFCQHDKYKNQRRGFMWNIHHNLISIIV